MDEFQTLDLSSEDTGLLNSSFHGLVQHQFLEHEEEDKKFELLEEMENIKLGDTLEDLEHSKLLPQPSEILEPERTRKNGKCNLRKSLAWDNAFFTSAGFLEPEELSSMLEGADKVARKMLPEIQENDVDRSLDSMSSLESLEADLFQDIRASIQRSSKSSKAANFSNPAGSAEKTSQSNQFSGKVALASQNKVNTKPTLKRPTANTQASGKMIKESSIGQQLPRLVARGRESAPSLPKLPKSIGKACPISTIIPKRASFGANRLQMEKDNSTRSPVSARQTPSRTPGLSGLRSGLPRPTQSMRLSSSGSLATNNSELTTSCSSLESVTSVSSKNVGKSPSNSIKRNKPPSPCPNFVLRNKTQQSNFQRSTNLKSSTKLSSSISPASSISEWSCESSSSISTSKQRFSKVKANPASGSPCKGIDIDSTSQNSLYQSNDKFSVDYEIQESGSQNPYVNEAVKGAGTSAKPSGLRMPSPKIGFFDGVKLAGHTPKGSIKSHLTTNSLSKSESGSSTPTGSNTKLRNIQPARTLMAVRNVNPETPHITSTIPTSVIPPQKTPSSTKISNATRAMRICPALPPKDQIMKSKNGVEKRRPMIEVGALVPDEPALASDPSLKSKMSSKIVESIKSPVENKSPMQSSPKEVKVYSAMEVSLNILSNFASLSLSPANSEIPERARSPLSVMNSLSNKDELFESSKGSTIKVVEEMDTLLPLGAQKEN